MGRSAEVFQVMKDSTEPMTCREICRKANLDDVEAKSVAAVLAAYQKSGAVLEKGSQICSITGHKAKVYVLAENEQSGQEVHEEIGVNNRVITITFDGGTVRVDSYIKKSA